MIIRTDAVVVTCIDYRLQPLLDEWIKTQLGYGNYNRVAFGGSVKNWDTVFSQIEMSRRVHSVNRVILINHQDCRAYGAEDSYERHLHDLRQARDSVLERIPDVAVELYYLWLDGRFERVD